MTATDTIRRLADRLSVEPKSEIGRANSPYLTRWTLFGRRMEGTGSAVFLHQFHRGDWDDALHDHPWGFTSVILSGGYWEWTADKDGVLRRRWYGPGRVLTRPARWRHRVELLPGRHCWSLVFRGPKEKSWSFFCTVAGRLTGKEVHWRSYVDAIETNSLGCGEDS